MQDAPEAANVRSKPWWRHGYVWLVISGPAIVVVASIVTFGIAAAKSDPLVTQDAYRRGVEIDKTRAGEQAKALLPALQGRNHAASPLPAR